MRAAVFESADSPLELVRLIDVDLPGPRGHETLVKVDASLWFAKTSSNPFHALWLLKRPFLLCPLMLRATTERCVVTSVACVRGLPTARSR